MKALNNFIFVWFTVFKFVCMSILALLIVYPFSFFVKNELFTHSAAFEIEITRKGLKKLEKNIIYQINRNWRE